MYGFKPKRPAQHLADGGFVATAKRMIGMTPDDPAQAARLAEYKANAAREKAAAATPAPAPAPAAAITQYTGMSAMQRREKEQGLADGGMVARGFKPGGMIRGPGDGTSDSIPDEMPPGTFIMPADSTQALGLDDEQAEGEKVPVRVSNGEYELPPERVQAIGAAVLQAIKGMTHTPTEESGKAEEAGEYESEPMAQGFKPKGEQPQQFFADGGSVLDPQKRANSFGDAAAMTTDSAAKPIQSAPAAPASANVTSGAAFGVFNRQETAGTRGGMMQPIAATGPKTFEPAKSVYGAETRMNSTTDPRSLTYGGSASTAAAPYRGVGPNPDASNAAQTPALASVSAPAAQPAPPLAPVVATSPGAGRGAIAPPAVQPSPAEMQTAPPRNGGQVSAQNMAAADSLAPSSPSTSATPAPAGFPGAPGYQGVTAPTVRNSTNDWAARNNLRNMQVSASSIANTPEWSRGATTNWRGQQVRGQADQDGNVAAYQAALKSDLALQQAQPGMDQAAMRENAGLQREGVQQQGATTRAGMQEAGANSRDAARVNLAGQELGMKREAQGFQTRAAAQLESLQTAYTAEKDPAKQTEIARQIRAVQGKSDPAEWGVQVTPTTKNPDGSTSEGSVIRYNKATGQAERVDVGQSAKTAQQFKQGEVYRDAAGNTRRWNGTAWEKA